MATVQSRAPETYINHAAGGSNPFYGLSSPWYVSHSNQITVLNLRANIEVNDHLSVGVFGNNLTNNRGALDALRILEAVAYERPASFGIDAHISY
jgi:outer membrane receptor protein involved in Fe transport